MPRTPNRRPPFLGFVPGNNDLLAFDFIVLIHIPRKCMLMRTVVVMVVVVMAVVV